MGAPSFVYPSALALLASGSLRWDGTGLFRALLVLASYEPKPEHRFASDVSGELSGGGYERRDLTGRRVVSVERAVELNADSIEWMSSRNGQVFEAAVVYRVGDGDAASPLLAYVSTGGKVHRGDVRLHWGGREGSGPVARIVV